MHCGFDPRHLRSCKVPEGQGWLLAKGATSESKLPIHAGNSALSKAIRIWEGSPVEEVKKPFDHSLIQQQSGGGQRNPNPKKERRGRAVISGAVARSRIIVNRPIIRSVIPIATIVIASIPTAIVAMSAAPTVMAVSSTVGVDRSSQHGEPRAIAFSGSCGNHNPRAKSSRS